MSSNVRVRFAPSPTGPLHLGGIRTALYNYLFARKHGGTFILRIEDTDRSRLVEGAEQHICESLQWCGILPDEGPVQGGSHTLYRQSERAETYRQYAGQLIRDGHAYYAFDAPEELEAMRRRLQEAKSSTQQYGPATRTGMINALTLPGEEVKRRLDAGASHVVRIRMPENEEIRFTDIVRGEITVNTSTLDDKVLFKSDGMPTYHLANVVDDHLMHITHVIRGEEWLPSAPIHHFLYRCLGWGDSVPQMAHLPLILKPDGKGKLSKRDCDRLGVPVFAVQWKDPATGEVSEGYREEGYYPEAFVNMLAFLGWNPGTEQEIFTPAGLAEAFSLERVGRAGARFDIEKVKWFQQQHLRGKDDAALAAELRPLLEAGGLAAGRELAEAACRLMKERVTFLKDIAAEGDYFFAPPKLHDAQAVKKKWTDKSPGIIAGLAESFGKTETFDAGGLEAQFKDFMASAGEPAGAAMMALRLVLTGRGSGPSVFGIMEALGREETLKRLAGGLSALNSHQ